MLWANKALLRPVHSKNKNTSESFFGVSYVLSNLFSFAVFTDSISILPIIMMYLIEYNIIMLLSRIKKRYNSGG